MPENLPLLIVVTGRPGAGKTTLARAMARELNLPLLSRDAMKVDLMSNGSAPEFDITLATYNAFFATIEDHLDRGISLVAEAGFQHSRWAPKLEPLIPLCDMRIVVCEVSAELAHARMKERERLDPARALYHPIGPLQPEYLPPDLPVPTLGVDTRSGYDPDFEEVLAFLAR
jgi:predicted kinase